MSTFPKNNRPKENKKKNLIRPSLKGNQYFNKPFCKKAGVFFPGEVVPYVWHGVGMVGMVGWPRDPCQDAPFRWLRHESGVHRVQRIPVTERKGRMQTSSVAVVLLPVAEEAAPELMCQFEELMGYGDFTLPETNSSPPKIGHTKRVIVFQPSIFRCMLVSGRVKYQTVFAREQEIVSCFWEHVKLMLVKVQ